MSEASEGSSSGANPARHIELSAEELAMIEKQRATQTSVTVGNTWRVTGSIGCGLVVMTIMFALNAIHNQATILSISGLLTTLSAAATLWVTFLTFRAMLSDFSSASIKAIKKHLNERS